MSNYPMPKASTKCKSLNVVRVVSLSRWTILTWKWKHIGKDRPRSDDRSHSVISEWKTAVCWSVSTERVIRPSWKKKWTVTVLSSTTNRASSKRTMIHLYWGKRHLDDSWSDDGMPVPSRSPSAGKLLHYTVEDGGPIEAGQVYAEIEVMKMVTELRCPSKGW